MESNPKVSVITPETGIKIIQDDYRTKFPQKQYIVIMTHSMKGSVKEKFYIAESVDDLYHQLMIDFNVEKHIKQTIETTKQIPCLAKSTVEPAYYFKSNINKEFIKEYRCSGFTFPYLIFATKTDMDYFIKFAQTEVSKIIDKYQSNTHTDES